MSRFFALVLLVFVLAACSPASPAPVDPTTIAPTLIPTAIPTTTPTKVDSEVWSVWEKRGFGNEPWYGEVQGKDTGCVVDLRFNPKACAEPIKVRPQVDTVVIKDMQFFMFLKAGEEITIDFNSGEFEFYSYYPDRPAFQSDYGILLALIDKDTPALILETSDESIRFINLAEGKIYNLAWKDGERFNSAPNTFAIIYCRSKNGQKSCSFSG